MPKLTPDNKPPRYVLKCSECGTQSDSSLNNPKAHNGWIFAPKDVCPDCIAARVPFRIVESTQGGRISRTIVFD